MTELTRHITSWRDEALRALAQDSPELINEKEGEWFPLDWALRANNYLAYTFLLRNGARGIYPILESRLLLVSYVEQLCREYFAATWLPGIGESIWEQALGNREVFFDDQEPTFSLSVGEKEDLQFLMQQSGITSRKQFLDHLGER